MKKFRTGMVILALCVFGTIGAAQAKGSKAPEAVIVILAVGAFIGLVLAVLGRRDMKRVKTAQGAVPAGALSGKTGRVAPPELRYAVKLGRADSYATPAACCSCLGPATGKWTASAWLDISTRKIILAFPLCRACKKAMYPWWREAGPVAMRYEAPFPLRMPSAGGSVEFRFANREYAESFARMNGGKLD